MKCPCKNIGARDRSRNPDKDSELTRRPEYSMEHKEDGEFKGCGAHTTENFREHESLKQVVRTANNPKSNFSYFGIGW